jgi:hypothetical protein
MRCSMFTDSVDFLGPNVGRNGFSGVLESCWVDFGAGDAGIVLSLFLLSVVVDGPAVFIEGTGRLVRGEAGTVEGRTVLVFAASRVEADGILRFASGFRSAAAVLFNAVRRAAAAAIIFESALFTVGAMEALLAVPATVGFLFSTAGVGFLPSSTELTEGFEW